MVRFTARILIFFFAVTVLLVSGWPRLAESDEFNNIGNHPQLAQGAVSSDGFRKLTGPEIQRVFEEIGEVAYPSYDGAGHGFQDFCNDDRYREEAAKDAWTKRLSFLDENLK